MKFAIALLSCSLVPAISPAIAQTGNPAVAETPASAAVVQPVSLPVSQVRIVRLSQVKGDVELDRRTGQTGGLAFVNLPIVAGAALHTKQGIAEVEFEDNSSLRLTPQSQVEFPHLGRNAAGDTITAVHLLHGSMYISLASGKPSGGFTVTAGNRTIDLAPSTHLRIDLDAPVARMVVFQGSATVTGPSSSLAVTKKKAVSFDTASLAAPEFVQIADAGAFDAWDKNAVDYHQARSNALVSGLTASPYSYGSSDLNYYGSFSNVGGCGNLWRPYMAGASFDPYSSGVWSWYPGQGYSFVSLYPWGWTPYHSGSWDFCPAAGGWGWNPLGSQGSQGAQGTAWRGLANLPISPTKGPAGGHVWPKPPAPPVQGGATLFALNVKSLEPSHEDPSGKFVFRAGSAGLGVPRGVFNNLGKVSQTLETRPSATASVSEHQAQAALMVTSHPTALTPSASVAAATRSSAAQSRGNTAASSSYSGSRSVSTGSPSAPSAPSAGSSGSHH